MPTYETIPPRFTCEATLPDGSECDRPATSEWVDDSEYHDPDEANPSLYATYRCSRHPVEDPDYEERPL